MFDREGIRAVIRGLYDLQALRIATGNRCVANFKSRLGQRPGKTEEEELDEKAKKLLRDLRRVYRKLADAMEGTKVLDLTGQELINTEAEFVLLAQYDSLQRAEEDQLKLLTGLVEAHPLWDAFLEGVSGAGPMMSAVLLSEIDIAKARYPSSLWKYAGLDLGPDGRGRGRYEEHLVTVPYTDKNGKPAERQGITFNPWLKTKLLGVLGPSFLRLKKTIDSPYRTAYYDYRHRLETDPARADYTKGRRHRMAIRYAVKRFLVDLYVAWRRLEGLPVAEEYSAAKQGLRHSA